MPGGLIRKIREEKKITQEEVARQMGISQNAFSKIENNLTQLTINHIKQISKALGVTPFELLREDFEIHKPLSIHKDTITRETVLQSIDTLKARLEQTSSPQHELYPVIMYELEAANTLLAHIE